MPKTTINDVAKHAKVSAMTVSRYFNKPELLSPKTRYTVKMAVLELKYEPDINGRLLKTGVSKLVAVIVPNVGNTFFNGIIKGAEEAASKNKHCVLIGSHQEDNNFECELIKSFLDRKVDGVIISPSIGGADNLKLLVEAGVPFVSIDREVPEFSNIDIIRADSWRGGVMLTEHLIEKGYNPIVFVGGPKELSSAQMRKKGYCEAMKKAGLVPKIFDNCDSRLAYGFEGGQILMREILSNGVPFPEAIVAANNRVASGIIDTLLVLNKPYPAIACFDNVDGTVDTFPLLTHVAQPVVEMGKEAFKILRKRINNEEVKEIRVFPFEFKERESSSTAKIREIIRSALIGLSTTA